MSFLFPTRAKVLKLPQQHRELVLLKRLGVRQTPEDWDALLDSLRGHDEVTGGRKKYALPARFLEVGLPVLRVLLADTAPGRPVGFAFQEIKPTLGEHVAIPDPPRSVPYVRRSGFKEAFAFDMGFQGEALLRDGSRVYLHELRRTRSRKWRQTRGGKTKFKSKQKMVYRYQVMLSLPRGVQAVRPSAPPPGGMQVSIKEGERARIKVEVKSSAQLGMEAILDLMTEAFRWSPRSGMTEAA